MDACIGIDIGGTHIVCGLVEGDGRLARLLKLPTEAERGSGHVLDKVAVAVKELQAGLLSDRQVAALGVGTPGLVDPERGVTLFASNLGWKEVPVAEELHRRTGLPVFVDNDVRMYVYGEAMRGAGQGYGTVLGITIGTGLAAALIHRGEAYTGSSFKSGELGHLAIPGIPYSCGCGSHGCLETAVSATGIVRQARELLKNIPNSKLNQERPGRQGEGYGSLTAADVSEAYDEGDPVAREVLQRTGVWLGLGLSYAVTLFDPDVLVIGGGVSAAGERLLGPMREKLKSSLYPGYIKKLAILPAAMPEEAGVIGSALAAQQRISSV